MLPFTSLPGHLLRPFLRGRSVIPWRAMLAGGLLVAAGCAGEDAGERAERLDEERRERAGVTTDALVHGEILPGLGVTGPRELPGVDSALSSGGGESPWGLQPTNPARTALFMEALTALCTPAPPPSPAGGPDPDGPDPDGQGGEPLRAAYPGRTTLNTLASPEPFEGAVLRMLLDDCDGDLLPIPFLVGDDASRTWVFEFQEDGLRLAHDHRDAAGTPGEANLYGGRAHLPPPGARPVDGMPGSGETILYFPADARTVEDRPSRAANVWAMALDEARHHFFYRLYLNGELRLEAAFDLTRSVAVEP